MIKLLILRNFAQHFFGLPLAAIAFFDWSNGREWQETNPKMTPQGTICPRFLYKIVFALMQTTRNWTRALAISRLRTYSVKSQDCTLGSRDRALRSHNLTDFSHCM